MPHLRESADSWGKLPISNSSTRRFESRLPAMSVMSSEQRLDGSEVKSLVIGFKSGWIGRKTWLNGLAGLRENCELSNYA